MNTLSHRSVYLRGSLIVFMAALGFLLTDTEARQAMPPVVRIYGGALLAGVVAYRAWIDQSLSRRKESTEPEASA